MFSFSFCFLTWLPSPQATPRTGPLCLKVCTSSPDSTFHILQVASADAVRRCVLWAEVVIAGWGMLEEDLSAFVEVLEGFDGS